MTYFRPGLGADPTIFQQMSITATSAGREALYGPGGAAAKAGATAQRGADVSTTAARETISLPTLTTIAALEEHRAVARPQCMEFFRKNPKVLQAAGAAGVDPESLLTACAANYAGFTKAMQDQGLTAKWYTDKRVLIGGGVVAALVAYLWLR